MYMLGAIEVDILYRPHVLPPKQIEFTYFRPQNPAVRTDYKLSGRSTYPVYIYISKLPLVVSSSYTKPRTLGSKSPKIRSHLQASGPEACILQILGAAGQTNHRAPHNWDCLGNWRCSL